MITKEEASRVINTSWYFSWHWGDDWEEKALVDAEDRLGAAINELSELNNVVNELKKSIAYNNQ